MHSRSQKGERDQMARNKYHQDIIEVLKEANGRSMSVNLIARYIYNKKVGLFAGNLSFEDIYQSVRFYLWAQSNRPSSPFIKGEKRGHYQVRKEVFFQLELDFNTPCPGNEEKEDLSKDKDTSPKSGIQLFE